VQNEQTLPPFSYPFFLFSPEIGEWMVLHGPELLSLFVPSNSKMQNFFLQRPSSICTLVVRVATLYLNLFRCCHLS
jgi:hypothetical protein